MTDFGVTADGFRRKTFDEILADVESDQRAEIDPNFDVSPDGPNGQNNRIMTRQLDELWRVAEKLHDSFDPDKATGDALENISKLTGVPRRGATYSSVIVDCTLDAGTTLQH